MEGVQTRNGLYGFEFRDVDQRRVSDGEERKNYDIKQLWQRSHEIINLAAQGFKNTDIAEILGITPATVSNTLNGKLGQMKLSEVRQSRDDEAKKNSEKIRILTAKAIQVYHEIFDNEDGQATLKERKDVADTVVLELSGLRAPTKTQNFNVSTVLTPAEINSFKERGLKAAKDAGFANITDITDRVEDEQSSRPIDVSELSSEYDDELNT
jgi:predicted transcriptional regulator